MKKKEWMTRIFTAWALLLLLRVEARRKPTLNKPRPVVSQVSIESAASTA